MIKENYMFLNLIGYSLSFYLPLKDRNRKLDLCSFQIRIRNFLINNSKN